MLIFSVETSCDDTAVALYDEEKGLLAHLTHSQIALHQPYGGVVPELASRDHSVRLLPLTQALLEKTQVDTKVISAIAYTRGPGLIGALMVGASFAKALAFALDIPVIGVHHLESHIMAAMLSTPQPSYPFVTLLVSGGHTLLLFAETYGVYRILGETQDDAVGEAFDKVAKTMGLHYPGGPVIEKLAQQGKKDAFSFPRPMLYHDNCDFSFSGLKTAVWEAYQQSDQSAQTQADIAYAFQQAAIDVLMQKTKRALQETDCRRLVIAGGVSANERLRAYAKTLEEEGIAVFFPQREFCMDNAAMVAVNGCYRLKRGEQDTSDADVKARWPLCS